MTRSPILAAMLALPLSAGPCLSEGTQPDGKLISENAVRTASTELYSDILAEACRNGWRYPRSQIEKGFRRHFDELKLQLVVEGYTIVPDVTANNSRRSRIETAFVARRQPAALRQFGCSRPYWLSD
jgi:hypothetical protein